MGVLTFETCWALSKEIIKQVTSSWSLFIELQNMSETFPIQEEYGDMTRKRTQAFIQSTVIIVRLQWNFGFSRHIS